jgi:hypothetical protein
MANAPVRRGAVNEWCTGWRSGRLRGASVDRLQYFYASMHKNLRHSKRMSKIQSRDLLSGKDPIQSAPPVAKSDLKNVSSGSNIVYFGAQSD